MVRVEGCCSCLSLRTGALIISCFYGTLGLLGAIGSFIFMEVMVMTEPPDHTKYIYKILAIVYGAAGAVSVIQTLVSILLFCGGYKRKTGLLLPWLVYSWIIAGLSLLSIAWLFYAMISAGAINVISYIALQGALTGLLFYSIFVVQSYRVFLKENGSSVPDNSGRVYNSEYKTQHI